MKSRKAQSPAEAWGAIEEEAAHDAMARVLGLSDGDLDAELARAGVTSDEVDRVMMAALEEGERKGGGAVRASAPQAARPRARSRPRPAMVLAFAVLAVLLLLALLNRRALMAYFEREPIGPDDQAAPLRPAQSAPTVSGSAGPIEEDRKPPAVPSGDKGKR